MLSFFTFVAAAAAASAPVTKPEFPVLPVLASTDCDDTATRSKRLAELSGDKDLFGAGDRFNAAWQAYLDARLAKLGMNQDEQTKWLLGMMTDKKFLELQKTNESLINRMQADVEELGKTSDEAQQCKTVSRMFATLQPVIANGVQQWELIDARIVEEARRRGIDLQK